MESSGLSPARPRSLTKIVRKFNNFKTLVTETYNSYQKKLRKKFFLLSFTIFGEKYEIPRSLGLISKFKKDKVPEVGIKNGIVAFLLEPK